MHNEHIMHISLLLYQFLVYPCASTRVDSKHIPVMIIPYSSVTEVHIVSLLGGAFDSSM